MRNRHPNRRPGWRVPASLMLLGSVLAWPGAAAADASCTVIPSNTTVMVGETVAWSVSKSDMGSLRGYAWEFKGGNRSSSTSAKPRVRYNSVGTFETKVAVKDRRNNTACNTTITVQSSTQGNQPPTANAGPDQTINLAAGQTSASITLNGSGSTDPDGAIVTYNWTGNPDPADSVSPTVNLAAGSYTFNLVVTDNNGASSAADTVNVTVNPAVPPGNQSPTANAGPDQTVTLAAGQTNINVTLNGSGSFDQDGTIVTYNWTGNPNPANTVSPTVNLTAGSYTFNLVVTDNNGASSAADTVNVTVNPAVPPSNQSPTANAGPDQTVTLAAGQTNINVTLNGSGSSDPDGTIATYNWTGTPDPANTVSPSVPLAVGNHIFTLVVTDNNGATSTPDTVVITVNAAPPPQACNPTNLNRSINSTSQSGCPDATVPQQAQVASSSYSVLAINDLGMHCGDLDTRISSILPPFQVLLAQVIQKGATPTLNPAGVSVAYSAAANPNDPILSQTVFDGVMANGDTYKTNFWDGVAAGTYDPFYPGGMGITPLATGAFPVTADTGPAGAERRGPLHCQRSGRASQHRWLLNAVQHAMPGMTNPYGGNAPQEAKEHYLDKPFFVNFPFGYVAADVNWFEGAGVPFAAYDDNGRENAYPLVRVQAKNAGGTVLSTVDTVLPISGEASCTNCHSTNTDYGSVHGVDNRTDIPTNLLSAAGLPVATSLDDPDSNMPPMVSLEYAADINVLRLHDLQHGARYVSTACDGVPANENCLNTAPAPCDIKANGGDGDATCLTYKALVQNQPAVCQTCHYTPALDLAQVGPKAGPAGSEANGRNQVAHQSNSRVMHNNHGSIAALDRNGVAMFPAIPAPTQNAAGIVTNQNPRLTALENNCYQCHPGTNVQCLRGAMFNGDMLCSDCHGSILQVGADFSAGVSPTNPGAFVLNQGNFYTPGSSQPRVPWANEPGCGSCHTGDVQQSLDRPGPGW